ncbi:MAG: enoyl-CoA hydratase/isomerase family protein [Betaproteobacteria bacterium]|nr:enoyl-CoA hydratase/isomerase family protein [Betaproteobacteria bacterium]
MNAASVDKILPLLGERLQLEFKPSLRKIILHFHEFKTRNAMSADTALELAALSDAFSTHNSAHPASALLQSQQYSVLVLKSHVPGVFLSGGDLKAISTFDTQQGEIFIQHMRAFTHFLRTSSLVSIALLDGLAAGGGSEVALACDLRVATSSAAQLDLAQTRWGVPAGWGMMTDLRRHGVYSSERRRAMALIAQERWNIDRLEQLGLLDARFDHAPQPERAFERWLEDFLARLGQCPVPLREALMLERPLLPDAELEEFDKKLFSQFWLSEVHRSRVADFIQARELSKKDVDTP